MPESSSLDGDHPNKHELTIQAKESLAKAILRLNPGFREEVTTPLENLSDRIGMHVRVADQCGTNIVDSMSIERVRCLLETDFLRSYASQNQQETPFGINKSEQWTGLKQDIVFGALQTLQNRHRTIIGQSLIPPCTLERNTELLEEANLQDWIPSVKEALRYMYIRIAGSSVGFGE